MRDRNSLPCASPSALTRSGQLRASAPSPIRLTMHWLRRSTASTRPSASTAPTLMAGTTSATSNSPRCRGCTGSTRSASTVTATTSRQRSSKQRSTLATNLPCRGLETNRTSLHQSQDGSPEDRLQAERGHRSDRPRGVQERVGEFEKGIGPLDEGTVDLASDGLELVHLL